MKFFVLFVVVVVVIVVVPDVICALPCCCEGEWRCIGLGLPPVSGRRRFTARRRGQGDKRRRPRVDISQAFTLPDWRYGTGPEDPSHWKEKYPLCGGKAQSPINIIPGEAVSENNINPLVFNGYDEKSHEFVLKNVEGHTAGLSVAGLTRPSVRGADVSNDYLLDQFHFHWGGNDSEGSEHLVQGTHFPLEMHMVHYSDAYANAATAQKEPNGLMVLSVLFQIGEHNNPDFQVFLKSFGKIIEPDQTVTVKLHPLRKLLPSNVQEFYTYHGSLTTPPCYQSVVWVVFKNHVLISEQQLNDFRMLHNGIQNHILINNFRPVQPLNGRVLGKST